MSEQTNIETEECSNRNIKVGMEFINQLRAEANRQKATHSIEDLLNIVVNNSQHIPSVESIKEMDDISEEFEITEE